MRLIFFFSTVETAAVDIRCLSNFGTTVFYRYGTGRQSHGRRRTVFYRRTHAYRTGASRLYRRLVVRAIFSILARLARESLGRRQKKGPKCAT